MFRVRGDTVELWPAHLEDRAWRFSFFGDELEGITEFDPLTGRKVSEMEAIKVYSNSHYVTPRMTLNQAVGADQGRAEVAAGAIPRGRQSCWKRSGWSNAAASTWR